MDADATPWRKSGYGHNGGPACVEAARAPGAVLIRDTRDNGTGPVPRVTRTSWRRLTASLQ